MSAWWPPNLWALFVVTLLNYGAQAPYYLANGQGRSGVPPSVSAIILLGLTLAWFLTAFAATRAAKPFGYWLLLAFVTVEGLFYLLSVIFGAAHVPLSTPNYVVKAVFFIGFLSGLMALLFAFALVRYRAHYQRRPGGGGSDDRA